MEHNTSWFFLCNIQYNVKHPIQQILCWVTFIPNFPWFIISYPSNQNRPNHFETNSIVLWSHNFLFYHQLGKVSKSPKKHLFAQPTQIADIDNPTTFCYLKFFDEFKSFNTCEYINRVRCNVGENCVSLRNCFLVVMHQHELGSFCKHLANFGIAFKDKYTSTTDEMDKDVFVFLIR